MVYIKSWTEYQTQAEKLYEQQPQRVGDLCVGMAHINLGNIRRDIA